MPIEKLKAIIEAALLAADRPLTVDRILNLFEEKDGPSRQDVKEALASLIDDCAERGVELIEVSSGYRYQVRQDYGEWINRMFEERAPRYSRALLETLALICYKQPITRAEVEDVRGVAVSTNIIRTLLDREWVKVVGHRDVPGKPAIYGTTRKLLDDLGLKKLDQLPPLAEIRDLDKIPGELELIPQDGEGENNNGAGDSNGDTSGGVTVASVSMVESDEVDISNEVNAEDTEQTIEADDSDNLEEDHLSEEDSAPTLAQAASS